MGMGGSPATNSISGRPVLDATTVEFYSISGVRLAAHNLSGPYIEVHRGGDGAIVSHKIIVTKTIKK